MLMKIENYKIMETWDKGRELANEIYIITRDGAFSNDFELKDNIRKSGISLISNIAEGLAKSTEENFINTLILIRDIATDIRSQLYLALKLTYMTFDEYERIEIITTELFTLIFSMIKTFEDQ